VTVDFHRDEDEPCRELERTPRWRRIEHILGNEVEDRPADHDDDGG
jgi:hypothetical protein